MGIGQNIKHNRERLSLSQEALAKLVGVSQQAVDRWENGGIVPREKTIQLLMNAFHCSREELFGDEQKTDSKGVRIPVLGKVVAGIPIDAIEEIIDYEEITKSLAETGDFFALQVKGDSMTPKLEEGDVVIIKRQSDVESGDIAIVLINGNDATVKQLKKVDGGIMLFGFNPSVYEPHFYSNKDIERIPVQVLGKVVEMRRKL